MRSPMLVLFFLTLSANAHAQIEAPFLFVEGAVFGDRDASLGGRDGTAPPMTTGGAGTIGFRVSRGFSARFDVEVPRNHSQPTFMYSVPGVHVVQETRERTITYGAMFAWHSQPARTVDIAVMAGFGPAVSQTAYTGFQDTFKPDGSLLRHEDLGRRDSYTNGSVALGMDVAVQLTRHVAVVPELRWYLFSEYGTVVRPKIAMRWTF